MRPYHEGVLLPKHLFDKGVLRNDRTWTHPLGKQLEYGGLGVAYVTVCNVMECNGMRWNGMEWMEWDLM